MVSGKTEELNKFDSMMFFRPQAPWEKKDRDRSLRGKDRIRARKLKNKTQKALDLLSNDATDD